MSFSWTAARGAESVSMRRLKTLALTTALAGGLFASADALAQSTGSQTVEQVVVTSKRPSLDGLGTVVKAAKASRPEVTAVMRLRKLGRKILFLSEIPKGATGKLQRIGLAGKLGLA